MSSPVVLLPVSSDLFLRIDIGHGERQLLVVHLRAHSRSLFIVSCTTRHVSEPL